MISRAGAYSIAQRKEKNREGGGGGGETDKEREKKLAYLARRDLSVRHGEVRKVDFAAQYIKSPVRHSHIARCRFILRQRSERLMNSTALPMRHIRNFHKQRRGVFSECNANIET